jgi:hypothetical protein
MGRLGSLRHTSIMSSLAGKAGLSRPAGLTGLREQIQIWVHAIQFAKSGIL